MEISDAKFDGGWLMLKTSASDALKWLAKEFKPREWDIVPHVEKRSRDANALAWAFIGKISNKLQIPPIDVYRRAISEIGGKSDFVRIRADAFKDFERAFTSGHLGRSCEIISERGGFYDVMIVYGSSDYDTRQMSALIDNILQSCSDLEIPTPEDEKIQSLLDDWERRYNAK